ncbi:MAG: hypothetical protein [Podoviridae sp. cty5g4]|nr:MAG: hypothetical protein [Podoviridae sp. cty5g4]
MLDYIRVMTSLVFPGSDNIYYVILWAYRL